MMLQKGLKPLCLHMVICEGVSLVTPLGTALKLESLFNL